MKTAVIILSIIIAFLLFSNMYYFKLAVKLFTENEQLKGEATEPTPTTATTATTATE